MLLKGCIERMFTIMCQLILYVPTDIARFLKALIFKIVQNTQFVPILILLDGNDPTQRV